VELGKEIRAMAGHKKEITNVAFSPDGKMLLTSSFDTTVRLWDVADGREIKRFTGHTHRVECAVFTGDGKRVVSCGNQENPTLRLWDVASGQQLLQGAEVVDGFLGVAVLPDHCHCVTAGRDDMVRLWRWER
jgi:WD40 repeat protein